MIYITAAPFGKHLRTKFHATIHRQQHLPSEGSKMQLPGIHRNQQEYRSDYTHSRKIQGLQKLQNQDVKKHPSSLEITPMLRSSHSKNTQK